jgi:branched-chain amino acid transport system permease protein
MEPCRLAVLVLAACALALPFFLWGFRTYQLTFAAGNAIAILGLNLIAGQAGLISLGHGAFYGLGAYTLAVLMRHWGVSAYAGILAAALVGLVTGYAFGRVVTRLAGFYLALTTFALALALPQTLKSSYVSPWTGGAQGLYLDRPGVPLRLPVTPDQWWYFVTLGILVLVLWMTRNLVAGRTGRAIRAMRDHPIAAQAAGIDVARYTALTFGVGTAYAGVAGALAALLLDFIAPESFPYWLSILFLVGSVFGGIASVWGAVAGGCSSSSGPTSPAWCPATSSIRCSGRSSCSRCGSCQMASPGWRRRGEGEGRKLRGRGSDETLSAPAERKPAWRPASRGGP